MKTNLFVRSVIILGIVAAGVLSAQAAGEVDSTFITSAYGSNNGNVNVIKLQPDGKMLIGGQFTDVNGYATSGIARLNVDGSVDTTFTPPDFFSNQGGIGGKVYAIAIQPDGKILVGGFIQGAGDSKPGIRRLNPDGSLDLSFFIEEFSPVTEIITVYDIGLQSDGKIIIAGGFGFLADNNVRQLRRLFSSGARDTSFAAPNLFNLVIKDIEVLPDDKIIGVGGGTQFSTDPYLAKFNADGSVDGTFTGISSGNGHIEAVKALPDGKFLVGGKFTLLNGFQVGRLSKINADGSIDLTFNQSNPGADNSVNDIAVRPDGKIVICGQFANFNTGVRRKIAQLNADGTLDNSFLNNSMTGDNVINDVELQADGKTLVGIINLDQFVSNLVDPFRRLNTDATTDTSFVVRVAWVGMVRKILRQPDGKILICGEFPFVNGAVRRSLARLNADGSLDTSFVPYFTFSPAPRIHAMALQPDGKILIGSSSGMGLKRLNADGSEDTSFVLSGVSSSSIINDIAVLPNGQILAGGLSPQSFPNKPLIRLNSNGSIDSSFPPAQPNGEVNRIILQPDGKIWIGGAFTSVGALARGRIARLHANGVLDDSFNPPGGANDLINDFEVQADGKIVLGGDFTALNGNGNIQKIGRLNADGSLDSSFIQATNGTVFAVKVQPDGKILIGGSMSAVSGIPRNGIARLNANGTLDGSFSTFANTSVWDINLQADGKILIGGEFTKINGVSRVRLARLLNAAIPPLKLFDYDGDGKSDVSVFRPSTNRWYVFKSSDATVSEATFGLAGDVVSPADYDGDGKTDLSIFRPSSGDWWYLSSINSQQIQFHWGASGDVPRPSDFDGDGKADFIVFRPSNNVWYRFGSSGATSITPFGLAGDKPVSGDFDGDGRSDPAIFRPSTGDWWYQSSVSGAQLATHWGISTDIPAPADFDGDGKTDFAVYRPSTGVWYVINSSNFSFLIMQFGIAEDKPVPADYDGDGKADIAVFRPSTGVWYQMKTTAGFSAQQFGVSTDIPTENAFVP